jgi:hypothetical protein
MDQDKNRIDKMEKSLYSRAHPREYSDERAAIARPEVEVGESWEGGDGVGDLIRRTHENRDHTQNKLIKKILWGAIAFFIIAVAIGAYSFFGGRNMVSAGNIDIVVAAPTSVAGGEELSLEITIQNKNNADLEGATLSVEYPSGTRVAGDLNTALPRQSVTVGTIPARGEVTKTMKAVLFGEKDSIKSLKISLEYRIQGASAVFNKDKNYDIGIASSPIILNPQYPSEVNSGQVFEFVLNVTSNTGELLHNVLVEARYPFGFTFESASPKSSTGTNTWSLGDLQTGDKRQIKIRGTLQGQDQEERTFQFSAGVADDKNPSIIATTLTTLQNSITIKKSAVDLALNIAGLVSQDYVASPGQKIPFTIVWTNNLPNQIVNAQILVKLSGPALDRNSVTPSAGGFYRSIDNTIIWDKNVNTDFASINPGDKGAIGFSLSPLGTFSSGARNQNISIEVDFSGSQLSQGNSPQDLSVKTSQNVKIASQFGMSARIVRSVGPFENTGLVPPKAEKPTTYSIIWTLTNSLNDASSVKVTTTLPSYVSWNNLVSPSNESITFDLLSNSVTWNAGTVKAGSGSSNPPREAAFQVTLLPSLGQVGTAPNITTDISVSGTDSYTGQSISQSKIPLTTLMSSDPQFKQGDDTVVK